MDSRFDPDNYFKQESNENLVKGEITYLLTSIAKFIIFTLILFGIITGILYLIYSDIDRVFEAHFSFSIAVILILFTYIAIGFGAGRSAYAGAAWVKAWTNNAKLDNQSSMRDLKSFVSIGFLVWFGIFYGVSTAIFILLYQNNYF